MMCRVISEELSKKKNTKKMHFAFFFVFQVQSETFNIFVKPLKKSE